MTSHVIARWVDNAWTWIYTASLRYLPGLAAFERWSFKKQDQVARRRLNRYHAADMRIAAALDDAGLYDNAATIRGMHS